MQFVRPWKRLVAFSRVTLAAGASTTVEMSLTRDQLMFHDDALVLSLVPGEYTLSVGGSSYSAAELTIPLSIWINQKIGFPFESMCTRTYVRPRIWKWYNTGSQIWKYSYTLVFNVQTMSHNSILTRITISHNGTSNSICYNDSNTTLVKHKFMLVIWSSMKHSCQYFTCQI